MSVCGAKGQSKRVRRVCDSPASPESHPERQVGFDITVILLVWGGRSCKR